MISRTLQKNYTHTTTFKRRKLHSLYLLGVVFKIIPSPSLLNEHLVFTS